jgi:Tocopherol cyclase
MSVNAVRFDPRRPTGHYESYYLRGNYPDRPLAFWLRYTVFSPAGRPADAAGELCAVVFDGESGAHTVARVEAPYAECAFSRTSLDVRVAGAVLDGESARGAAGAVSWDLRYAGTEPPLYLLPRRLYRGGFPKAKSLVPLPLARFTGSLEVAGRRIEVDGWPGSQNHNWGSRHTDRYAFGQVAGFDGAPDSFLEVATARARIGPLWTPELTFLVLRHGGREYALTSLRRAARARARVGGGAWTFATQDRRVRVAGRIEAPPSAFVLLEYRNPPGGIKYCQNTKLARCELTLTDRASGKRETLTSAHGALFELLGDEPGRR